MCGRAGSVVVQVGRRVTSMPGDNVVSVALAHRRVGVVRALSDLCRQPFMASQGLSAYLYSSLHILYTALVF
jgi:hypothetical protein